MLSLNFLDLLLLSLATLYAAQTITGTAGPASIFKNLRDRTRNRLGGLFDCIWCAAFWVALILIAAYVWLPLGIGRFIVYVFAIAGAALALRSFTGAHHG